MCHTTKQLNMFSRLVGVVLTLLLVLGLLPTTAFAAGGSTGELQWQLSGGTLTISGSGPMPDYTDANMPPWYDSAEAISRIVVAEGVTSVGSLAFYGCSTATGVSLGSTVTSIGDRAFKNCHAITYVGFPAGLTAIGEAAFESCEKLNGIMLPSGLLSLGSYAFNRCTSLSAITIPASVTDFGMVTFAYCTGLTQAVIQCPITKLPDWTFYGCTALSSVSLPETVTQTGDNAFHDCASLSSVYYSGVASDTISEALTKDETTQNVPVIQGGTIDTLPPGTSVNTKFDDSTSVVTNVTTSENATVTKTQETDYEYTVNGNDATLEEVLKADETDDVTATGTSTITIDATVQNPEGWKEVADSVKDTINNGSNQNGNVQVNVQLPDSKVNGEDLAQMAGKDVTLTISTGSGSTWIVDESTQTKNGFEQEQYDLDFTVTKMDENKTDIPSDTVYKVKFASDTDFNATVGVNLKVNSAYQYATLYEKNIGSMTELQTVMVDENGYAWFSLANVDAGQKYYVGMNVEGVDFYNAVIPDSLQDAHGIDYTLTDANGTKYQVTGRSSRWGITGARFAIYVAIAIGGVVLLVTLIMVTLNKISKSKAKYAVPDQNNAPIEIDEEAIRLQVMQEMLQETQEKQEKK